MTNTPILTAMLGAILCVCVPKADAYEIAEKSINTVTTSVTKKSQEKDFNVVEFLSTRLVKPGNMGFEATTLESSNSERKFVVLYFSAHWCPACKKITPRLVEFYNEKRKHHSNFEFVFVSSDRSEEEMFQYMKGYRMPWAALKFSEKIEDKSILKHAGRGIPCVVVIDPDGEVIASSFEEGKYQGPIKPVESLARILDDQRAQKALATR